MCNTPKTDSYNREYPYLVQGSTLSLKGLNSVFFGTLQLDHFLSQSYLFFYPIQRAQVIYFVRAIQHVKKKILF